MTEKLYYKDSHIFQFTATVMEITEYNGHKAVILDKTAFFPEGGGQPGDVGTIDHAEVYDVHEIDGKILHYIKDNIDFAVGNVVNCRLNEELRFLRMQSHSGEHILSGVAHTKYGAENVGFHMIDEIMTVDLDKPLNKEQLAELENEANQWIYKNVSVKAEVVSPEQLCLLQYRSKLDLKDNVRIVTIDGCDACACCAPHVSFTGEIGVIKILSSVSHRGGIRITLVCGKKAFETYCDEHAAVMGVSALLKSPNDATLEAVTELLKKTENEKNKTFRSRQKLYRYIYNGLKDCEQNIIMFVEDFTPDELRELADLCKAKTSSAFAVFSGSDEEGYSYAVSSEKVKLRSFIKQMNTELNAKGGGRDEMLQGKLTASREAIQSFFTNSEVWTQ